MDMIEPQHVVLTNEQLAECNQRIKEWEDTFKLLSESDVPSGHELMSLPERIAIVLSHVV